jgi:hypothetical protein
MQRRAFAFTLVEVLVTTAIVATLAGVLLPVIAGVRSRAWLMGCAATQRTLHTGAMDFTMRNGGALPGVNTSGRPYLGNVPLLRSLTEPTLPEAPTTTFDWISPSLGAARSFSSNRAERTRQIFGDLACPAARDFNDAVWGWAPDREHHFERVLARDGFPQISYLAPASFMLAGPERSPAKYRRWGWRGPAMPPGSYPRVSVASAPTSPTRSSSPTARVSSRARASSTSTSPSAPNTSAPSPPRRRSTSPRQPTERGPTTPSSGPNLPAAGASPPTIARSPTGMTGA